MFNNAATTIRGLSPLTARYSPKPMLSRNFSVKRKRGSKEKKTTAVATRKNTIPALLCATASPFVYVARTALDDSINPLSLFSEGSVLPSTFAKGEFEYVSPKALKHEFPKHGIPEVAFLGRSNVGKSSLVNSVLRKNLCITSKHPGRTQQPFYYGIFSNKIPDRTPSNARGFIIDLPGYGYGEAPNGIVEAWQADTQDLLINRRDLGVLKRLFLLVDARRDEPTEMDRTVMTWLEEAEIPYSLVLTKTDRASKPQVIKLVNDFCVRYASQNALEGANGYAFQSPVVHTTSSKRNWGLYELMASVEAEFDEDQEDDNY